ncbi:MAG: methylmalonyl Co-A mutase-associated GTPase MeaB [Flavobacteriaceae bacterium]
MSTQKNTDQKSISKIKYNRKQIPTAKELANGILNGNKTALARGITIVESTQQEHLQKASYIIEKCLSKKSDSIRIGITGVPGVGKSTFIEVLGTHLTALGKKVAVLAIDPTSSQSRGSILGDKTRMYELVKDPNAFIRPSPSSESLGGVARKTRETMILCEAAGYDVILIETVGVGQSETAVHSMVDFFLLLKLAGAGDELQGIKRGIIEMADVLVINKADGNNAQMAQAAKVEFTRALHLYPPKENGWLPKVLTCSALENTGISEVWNLVMAYIDHSKKSRSFTANRKNQNKSWLLQHIDNQVKIDFYQHPSITAVLPTMILDVTEGEISPFKAAEKLMDLYRKNL